MTTVLHCGGCGRRCGAARRIPNAHIAVEMRSNFGFGEGWEKIRSRLVVPMEVYAAAARPEWPPGMNCPHCGAAVYLDRARAHRVGSARRLTTC